MQTESEIYIDSNTRGTRKTVVFYHPMQPVPPISDALAVTPVAPRVPFLDVSHGTNECETS